MRVAWVMKLKPGCEEIYKQKHDEIWPELVDLLKPQGDRNYSIYRYGLTLHNLGRPQEAATQMQAVIEAVRTSPAYKYRAEKRWMNEAQSFLRSQSA